MQQKKRAVAVIEGSGGRGLENTLPTLACDGATLPPPPTTAAGVVDAVAIELRYATACSPF